MHRISCPTSFPTSIIVDETLRIYGRTEDHSSGTDYASETPLTTITGMAITMHTSREVPLTPVMQQSPILALQGSSVWGQICDVNADATLVYSYISKLT